MSISQTNRQTYQKYSSEPHKIIIKKVKCNVTKIKKCDELVKYEILVQIK